MHSLIGIDQPSIVTELSSGLCKNGSNLGDSNMVRLGNYFTTILMVEYEGINFFFNNIIKSVCFTLNLDSHLVQAQDRNPKYFEPDVRISLFAENRMDTVEGVTVFLLIRD
jgi:glycine cleavage system transcriptional repressor